MSRKKVFILILVCLISMLMITPFCKNCQIRSKNYEISFLVATSLNVSDDLADSIDQQIDGLEDNQFDEILNNLGDKERSVFQNQSFWDKIQKIITGKETFSFGKIVNLLLSLVVDNISGIIPVLAIICAVSILASLLLQFRGKSLNKPLGDIIHFACFAIVVVLVLSAVYELLTVTSSTLSALKKQMEISFPIMLTLMASLGAGSSVAIYQPLLAMFCGVIMQIFSNVLLPLFSICLIFNVVGNLTSSVKLSKLTKFLESSFKYIIGFTFTIFAGFMAVSGIVVGSFDGASIRATKFAIKSYVPIMGGYLSDGFSLLMASSILIKNAVGYSGLVVMLLTILSPILKIVLFKLGLMLVSGIIESVADKRVTDFISKTAKSLDMLVSVILAFSFGYLVCVGLLMCSANAF